MKYNVTGVYKHEETVDTESVYFKHWRESWRGRDYQTEEEAVVNYVRNMLGYQIIDDEGHGTLTPLSLDWKVSSS